LLKWLRREAELKELGETGRNQGSRGVEEIAWLEKEAAKKRRKERVLRRNDCRC
jgi:hypothetical protein